MARKGENIYKRKDGRWEGRYRVGYKESGKAKYRSVYGASYQSVKEKLLLLKAVPDTYADSGRMTISMLSAEWLAAIKLRTKPSTYANYRMKLDKHILPEFGGIRYNELTVKMLHEFIDSKLNGGLSAKYVSDIVIVFKSMSKYISKVHNFRDPIADVILPKVQKKEMKMLDAEQQRTLCRHLTEDFNSTSACILLSLFTGLRIGECTGVKWSDIDLAKSILTVRRTVQRMKSDNGTQLRIDTPKSRSSQRSIPIPTFLTDLLKQIRSSPENYLLSGNTTPIEPRTLQRRFKAILKKANLPSVTYHSLRHLFACNCVSLGFDIKTLSELLGHSSVQTSLNLYVHSSMERKKQCMEMLKLPA